MINKMTLASGIGLLIMILAVPAVAGGIQREGIVLDSNFGVGARAMGMGGAHLAAAEDISAIYWNPAGLAKIRRIELSGTISHESQEIDTRFFGTSANSSISNTRLNSIGLAYPFPTLRGSLVAGFSVNRVHSFDLSYLHNGYNEVVIDPENGVGDAYETEKQYAEGGLYVWGFSGAMDVSKQLSLGLSLNIWDGSYNGNWDYREEDIHDHWDNTYFYDVLHITEEDDFDLDGFNLIFGGIYRASKHLNLGFSVASETTIKFDGEQYYKQENYDFTDDMGIDEDTYAVYEEYYTFSDAKLPWQISGGLAYTQKMFKLAADFSYATWSEVDFNREDPQAPSMYDDTFKWRLGGEVLIPNAPLRFRAGVFTDPIPYQGTEIDKDRMFFTLGAGALIDRVFSLDVAYVTGSWERYDNQFDYTEEGSSDKLFITGAYHF